MQYKNCFKQKFIFRKTILVVVFGVDCVLMLHVCAILTALEVAESMSASYLCMSV